MINDEELFVLHFSKPIARYHYQSLQLQEYGHAHSCTRTGTQRFMKAFTILHSILSLRVLDTSCCWYDAIVALKLNQ